MTPAPERARQYATKRASGTVLLIEDTDYLREIIEHELERLGYHVISAPNGRTGLRLALDVLPDVILSDYSMPEMNGLEVLEYLRHSPRAAHLPFILMSSYPLRMFVHECERLKASALLEKPFELAELKAALQQAISEKPVFFSTPGVRLPAQSVMA